MRRVSIAANRLSTSSRVVAGVLDDVDDGRERRDVPDHRHRAVLRVQRAAPPCSPLMSGLTGLRRPPPPSRRGCRPPRPPAAPRGSSGSRKTPSLGLVEVGVVGRRRRLEHLVGVVEHQADVAQPADARLGAHGRDADLDARVAEGALLGLAGLVVEVDLLVRAAGDAHAPASAPVLVDEDDAVLRALVDRAARARCRARRVEAVLADTGQVEHEGLLELQLHLVVMPLSMTSRLAFSWLPPRLSSQLADQLTFIGLPEISEIGRATGKCCCAGALISVS